MARCSGGKAGDDEAVEGTQPEAGGLGAGRLGPDPSATKRAFLVHLVAGADATNDAFCGRVQHLASCDGGNFGSAEALIAIIRRVLEGTRDAYADE